MSDERVGGGIGCIGVIIIIIIILLLFGIISIGDIWNVIVSIWDFVTSICCEVCCGIIILLLIASIILPAFKTWLEYR